MHLLSMSVDANDGFPKVNQHQFLNLTKRFEFSLPETNR